MWKYDFGDPSVYNQWYIFPDTTLNDISLYDCSSSISGVCLDNIKTIKDCISECEKDDNCESGYFIETEEKNICVPLKDTPGDQLVGPYYELRNKDIYPEMKNVKSSVFVNRKYSYPPNRGNNIFYFDKLYLKNVGSGKHISIGDKKILDTKPTHLQFLPNNSTIINSRQSIIVRNGDEVIINRPNTTFVLRTDLSWVMRLDNFSDNINTFRIFSTNVNKKFGDLLDYTDDIYFTVGPNPIVYDNGSDKLLVKHINPVDLINNDNKDIVFSIESLANGYYCDKECKKILIRDTDKQGGKATYKNRPVDRNPNCWGLCHHTKKDKNIFLTYITIILLLVAILILIFVFL